MNDTRSYRNFPANLDLHACLATAIDQIQKRCEEFHLQFSVQQLTIKIDSHRKVTANHLAEGMDLLSQFRHPAGLDFCFWLEATNSDPRLCTMYLYPGSIEVSIQGSVSCCESLHSTIKDCFQASIPPNELIGNPVRIGSAARTIFVAHRFDPDGEDAAKKLISFLRALGCTVTTGEAYSGQTIPEKVRDRIDANAFLIAVFTPGDHTWVLSEASYAAGQRKHIIQLVDDSIELKKGILGQDSQHFSFEHGFIETCFTDLLRLLR